MNRNLERYRAQLDRCCGPAPKPTRSIKAETEKMWDELAWYQQLERMERMRQCLANTDSTT